MFLVFGMYASNYDYFWFYQNIVVPWKICVDDTTEPFENSIDEEKNKGENSEAGSHEKDRHV